MTAVLDGLTAGHTSSPFGGPTPPWTQPEAPEPAPATTPLPAAESPFAALVPDGTGGDAATEADLLEALHDEDFTDALAALVDEAAARHLADQTAWAGRLTEGEALDELEEWIEPLAQAAEQGLDRMGQALEHARPETMTDAALQRHLEDAAGAPTLGSEAFDHFLGGLLKKAGQVVGSAVKAVGKAVGKVLPVGAVLKKLAALVRPLLKKMLAWSSASCLRPSGRSPARSPPSWGSARRRRSPTASPRSPRPSTASWPPSPPTPTPSPARSWRGRAGRPSCGASRRTRSASSTRPGPGWRTSSPPCPRGPRPPRRSSSSCPLWPPPGRWSSWRSPSSAATRW